MDAPPAALAAYLDRLTAGAFWDAHEALEEHWQSDRDDLWKALIQLAAALLHVERGNRHGAVKLTATARRYLAPIAAPRRGVDPAPIRAVAALLATAAADDELHGALAARLAADLVSTVRAPS